MTLYQGASLGMQAITTGVLIAMFVAQLVSQRKGA